MIKSLIGCVVSAGVTLAMLPVVAEEYTATSTWFSVSTGQLKDNPTVGASVDKAGTWTAIPSTGSAVLKGGKIEIAADYAKPLSFAPISTSEPLIRITTQVELTVCDELQTIPGKGVGWCVVPDGKASALKWQVWNGSQWTAGAEVSVDDVGSEFEVTTEIALTNRTARCFARKLPDGESFDICGWIACPSLASSITDLSFYGETTLGDYAGLGVRKVILEPGVQQENIEVVVIQGKPGSAILVDKGSAWMAKYRIPAAQMNDTAANGLTYLQSYVLGLDPTSAVAKPLVMTKQNPAADKIAFCLGGVRVNRSSGARVSYRVKTFAKPGGTMPEATSAPVAYDQTTLLDVPTDTAPVKYYRIEFAIE